MPAKRLELGTLARRDLAAIWEFTAKRWDPGQAEAYSDRLNAAMTSLAEGARIGHRARDNRYLVLRVNAHMIYFRSDESVIEVVRILHSHQLAERHLPR